jgi:hypothetical protein
MCRHLDTQGFSGLNASANYHAEGLAAKNRNCRIRVAVQKVGKSYFFINFSSFCKTIVHFS